MTVSGLGLSTTLKSNLFAHELSNLDASWPDDHCHCLSITCNQKPRYCVGVVVVCFPFMSTYSNCVLCPQVYASTMHNYVNVMSVNGILEKEPLALVISNNKTVCQYQSLLCSAVWTFLIISNSEKNEQEEGIEAFSESDLSCRCLHNNIDTVFSGNQCIN